jgi:hypothetical protein
MPDKTDTMLEELLAYPSTDSSEDLFVVDVMRKVQKERRNRRLILWAFGGIGALFGVAGAAMLSDAIGQLFTGTVSSTFMMQLPLFAVGAAAFYSWIMNDDLTLGR